MHGSLWEFKRESEDIAMMIKKRMIKKKTMMHNTKINAKITQTWTGTWTWWTQKASLFSTCHHHSSCSSAVGPTAQTLARFGGFKGWQLRRANMIISKLFRKALIILGVQQFQFSDIQHMYSHKCMYKYIYIHTYSDSPCTVSVAKQLKRKVYSKNKNNVVCI